MKEQKNCKSQIAMKISVYHKFATPDIRVDNYQLSYTNLRTYEHFLHTTLTNAKPNILKPIDESAKCILIFFAHYYTFRR